MRWGTVLAELSIKDFAIIDSISVSFDGGLTVLTGETGAGKSIIIDAIMLLAGGRGSTEFVRYGSKKAELEGLFHIDTETHPAFTKLKENGLEDTDGMIVLRREISAQGKSTCRINGKLVTLSILRDVGQMLIDIHSQHENQVLMEAERHLTLLDQFNNKEIQPLYNDYLKTYQTYHELQNQLKKLTENEQELVQRIDLLQFQLQEINQAELKSSEDVSLVEERKRLVNYEKLYQALHDSYEGLYGDGKGLEWITHSMQNLEDIKTLDSDILKLYETIESCYYALEETAHTVRHKLDALEFNPDRLNIVEERLGELSFLKKKYGHTVEEIISYSDRIKVELDQMTNRDEHIANVKVKLESLTKELLNKAGSLSVKRKEIAQELTKSVHKELAELFMGKSQFLIDFKTNDPDLPSFKKSGIDQVQFLISANPGEPLRPIQKVVSGGELSRLMLALKTIFSKHQGITSVIFDEVDTGVSGRVAQAIAEKIYTVSINSQVLCISHLPQVAAMADSHLHIAKKTSETGRTKTVVEELDKKEKIKEIGRMISGVKITDLTKQHANELLEMADRIKSKNK